MKTIFSFRNIRTVVVLITGVILSLSIAQTKVIPKIKPEEVPPEVQKVIDETMSGQHAFYEFDRYKVSLGFDSTTKLSDIRAGKPFKTYKFNTDTLRSFDDRKFHENIPVSAMVKPTRTWMVPVFFNDKCVRLFSISKSNRNPQWHPDMSLNCEPGWQKLWKAWPDSAGYHPTIIQEGAYPRYFHIPEKDDYNLTPLMRYQYDSLSQTADTSFRVLMNSSMVLKHVKNQLPPKPTGGVK